MNNIEILEKFIDKQKSNKGTFVATDFEITAIENLIQENKELKKQIPSPDNYVPLELQTNLYDVVNKRDYILKSKVKEKIEYYKKIDNSVGIMILEKLLEN